eukprot:scaffold59994_cov68-Phaeocystis_antarctica.AAC.1
MATDALPRAPLSREPCTGASVELSPPSPPSTTLFAVIHAAIHTVTGAPSECSAGVLTDLFNATT